MLCLPFMVSLSSRRYAPKFDIMTKKVFLLTLSLLFTSCFDHKANLQKFIPKDDDTFARRFIEVVSNGDYVTAQQMLDTSGGGENAAKELRALHEFILHGKALSIDPIGCNIVNMKGDTRTNISYQIHFPDSWAVGNVYVGRKSGVSCILGSHFQQVPDSLEVLNRFTLHGKSPIHYAVLAACIAIPAFILYTLVVCIRSCILRKWLWTVFILFGIFQLSFDWTSGRIDIQPISILLFGETVIRASPYSAWVLSCGVPLGAIIFLSRRRKLIVLDDTQEE